MNRLSNRIAIVTGGASGIGLAVAQLFEEEGARVVVFDTAAVSAVDVTSPAQVESAVQQVVEEHTRLDILVNVAGGSGRKWGDGPAEACTIDGWEKTLALNLDSVFYCCKYALNAMLPEGRGAIVNVSSVLGMVGGDEDFATHAYASSKGAVISLTRSIASYYAPRGIRANVICPGLIATPMSRRAQESEEIRARLSRLQPLTGTLGSPQDVANAALFLASEEASFITGCILTVDGGWTVR